MPYPYQRIDQNRNRKYNSNMVNVGLVITHLKTTLRNNSLCVFPYGDDKSHRKTANVFVKKLGSLQHNLKTTRDVYPSPPQKLWNKFPPSSFPFPSFFLLPTSVPLSFLTLSPFLHPLPATKHLLKSSYEVWGAISSHRGSEF